jgi:hypothetical protein
MVITQYSWEHRDHFPKIDDAFFELCCAVKSQRLI